MKIYYKLKSLFLLFAVLITSTVTAQKDDQLKLKSGNVILDKSSSLTYNMNELSGDRYFRIIQFNETPTQKIQNELAEKGIELMAYLPEHAFYAAIDKNVAADILNNYNVYAVSEVLPQFKLTPELADKKYPDWSLVGTDHIELTAISYPGVDSSVIKNKLTTIEAQTVLIKGNNIVKLIIPINKIDELYEIPEFFYFEPKDAPELPEGYDDVSNHRSNVLQNPLKITSGLSGAGVTIMLQDDGIIGPHIDYQGRIDHTATSNNGDHGDHVAGIIMGAGNLNPDAIGNAPGSALLVYSSGNSNYDFVPTLYEDEGVVITSKSYGNGLNNGYTSLASELDQQCRDYEALIHVFSAGNSGTDDGGYGAGAGWGNITGGHKQGKNVIAVGNLSNTDDLANGSSRGPATDGRIKPDICAVGTSVFSTIDVNTYDIKSGTSMACPGVSGTLALLYEAYRNQNNGDNPDAALMKGAILNTAEDLGNPGPDFKYGWGRINAKRAHDLLMNNQYSFDYISMGENIPVSLDVPSGVKQVRIMLYWKDVAGTPSANPALVNDLDLKVITNEGTEVFPWVLNPTPNATLLNQNAQQGVDDLNNMEQVTIDNPSSGNYTVSVNGTDIPSGPQKFYVLYEYIFDDVVLTYPIGGETFVPGQSELIRWDAIADTGSYVIEYSTDGGQNWTQIAGSVPGDWRSYPWNPSVAGITGDARIRITYGASTDMSAADFSIIGQPQNLNVEWACPNAFNFSWDPVPGAIGYEVFLLGDEYMDSAGYVTTNNATVYASSTQTQWYSVRAYGPNGAIGKRAVAEQKSPGTFGCTMNPPSAFFTALCASVGSGSCMRFEDLSTNAGQGAAWEWFFPGGSPSYSTDEKPLICYDGEGTYDVTLVVKNGVGVDTVSSLGYVVIADGVDSPINEDFEEGVLKNNWTVSNDGNGINWEIDNAVSMNNYGTHSIKFNNQLTDTTAVFSEFQTSQTDLSEDVIYALSFDIAYAGGGTNADSLRVYATNNCGDSRTLLYKAGGDELATVPFDINFKPEYGDWKRIVNSLEEMYGNTSVSFIFESESYQGNTIYVDNINVQVSEENFSQYELTVFPNPFGDSFNISGLEEGEDVEIRIIAMNGDIVMEKTFNAWEGLITVYTQGLANGVYFLRVLSPSKTHKEKIIKVN
ncbi:S8 family serine peptidase [Paracrocinitomix mangrovi]|uniref:S8 family serine peptidase n=1 Tax=Paracrocinitomix mangrovi TaxID=2862509 RepID=UPI001C8ECE3B|nr:S8 family serine peptidase [Paracrocinitomix mangrovi]UKN02145.1 S8 family serine peptidase [Paracrocinitomix mangrovi]